MNLKFQTTGNLMLGHVVYTNVNPIQPQEYLSTLCWQANGSIHYPPALLK